MPGWSSAGTKPRTVSSRLVLSILITSAPRWASCSVQKGPAHTHVKSQTRMPSSGFIVRSFPSRALDNRQWREGAASRLAGARCPLSPRGRLPIAEDFVVVLSQQRRGGAQLPGGGAELPGCAGVFQFAGHRMADRGEEAAHAQVLILQQVTHRRERRKGEFALQAARVDLLDCVLRGPFLDEGTQHIPRLGALEAVVEDLPACPFRRIHPLNEALPLGILHAEDKDEAVLGGQNRPGLDDTTPQPAGDAVAVGVVHDRHLEKSHYRLLHGEVDVLSLGAMEVPREQST